MSATRAVSGAPGPLWPFGGYYLLYFGFFGAFTPYIALYYESIGRSALEIGVLMALLQIARIFGPPFWSWLADRASGAAVIRATSLAACLAFCGLFLGTSFAWLVAVMALMSFVSSAQMPLVESATVRALDGDAGRYARLRIWGSVGFAGAVVCAGYLLDTASRAALLPVCLALLVLTALFAWLLPARQPVAHERDPRGGARAALREPAVRALLAACFLMALAHGPYYVFFSLYLAELGYGKALIGWLWALGVLAEIAVFWCLPLLLRRYSLVAILAASFALAVLRFAVIGFGAGSLLLVSFAQLLHAATFGSYHAAAVGLIHRRFGPTHGAKGQALYTSLSFGFGGSLGSILAGWAWQPLGPALTFAAGSVAAGLGLMIVLSKARIPESRAAG